jgi:cytochrome c
MAEPGSLLQIMETPADEGGISSRFHQPARSRIAMRRTALIAGFALLSATLTGEALAAGDAAAGKVLFQQKCAICHSVDAGVNKIGPSLHGVVGRKAGSLEGYTYSEAMKNANRTWDEATLSDYLTNPREKIPGIKMIFAGLPNPQDRDNIIAYLSEQK